MARPRELAPLTDEQNARDRDLLRAGRKQSAGPLSALNAPRSGRISQLTDHRLAEQASDNSCKAGRAAETKGASHGAQKELTGCC